MDIIKDPGKAYTRRELVITRVFDAPRSLVWKTWTEPARVRRWWGPKGFSAPICKSDFRVGGTYLYCMRSPLGRDYWSTGVFREIVPPERIVATDSFADAQGRVVPAAYYGMSPAFPLEMLVTVTFEDLEGKTRLTLVHELLPKGENRTNTRDGWLQSLDKFEEALKIGDTIPFS